MTLESAVNTAPSIALVDAETVLVDSLARVLALDGFRVTAASTSASEFLAGLQGGAPDVVVVGLGATAADGEVVSPEWTLIQLLRLNHPATRIVVLSGSHDPALVQRAEAARVAAFLTKVDVRTVDLIGTVHRVVRGERIFPMFPFAGGGRPAPPQLGVLTQREVEVLRHVGAGYDNLKIAACLAITERTVRAHVSNLYRKLGPENRAQLALLARELGLRPPDA